jgi:hypothetical protein
VNKWHQCEEKRVPRKWCPRMVPGTVRKRIIK